MARKQTAATSADKTKNDSTPTPPEQLKKCCVVMSVPMAGIGIDWAVGSEQQLLPLSAHRLVSANHAKYLTEEDAELAAEAVAAEAEALAADEKANADSEEKQETAE